MDITGFLLENWVYVSMAVTFAIGYLWNKVNLSPSIWKELHDNLRTIVLEAANNTNRTYVNAIKAGKEDGKLTEEERAEALRLTKEEILKYVSLDTLKRLAGVSFWARVAQWVLGKFGMDKGAELVDSMLNKTAEMAVTELKTVAAVTEKK